MKKGQRYYHGSHSRHRLCYHFVWIPKYRKRVLRGEVATDVKQLLYQCAQMNDWWIESLEVLPDHIHLLVELPPAISVSQAVKTFKGGSSRAIRQAHPELEEWLWGDSLWATGYFAETVGKVAESDIRNYLKDQQRRQSIPKQRSLGL